MNLLQKGDGNTLGGLESWRFMIFFVLETTYSIRDQKLLFTFHILIVGSPLLNMTLCSKI